MDVHTVDTIVSEDGRMRVRIVIDTDAGKPYDDGSSPVVAIYYPRGRTNAEQSGPETSYTLHDGILRAFARWATETELAERYCRIFHGATTFEYLETRDGDTYVTLDPAHWRNSMGLTDDYLAAHPDVRAHIVNMDEWRAYVEGDVYGIVAERLTTWTSARGETRETWDEIDGSLWGFYGQGEYLTESAREILADAMQDA